MDSEIETLRSKLKKARFALAQTQSQMELHKIRTRQIVMAWKLRIHEAEQRLRIQKQERDIELKDITSQLLFFEGQLKREQNEIRTMLRDKDETIREQEKKIKELRQTNQRLHRQLDQVRKSLPDGLHVSFLGDKESSVDDEMTDLCPDRKDEAVTSAIRKRTTKKKARLSTTFRRSLSLPGCINTADINDLSSGSMRLMPESGQTPDRDGGREMTSSCDRSPSSDVKNIRNMSYSEQDLRKCSKRNQIRFSGHNRSLDDAISSRFKLTAVSVSETKSNNMPDRIKRAFMRPRDVKKRSKMRFRSNSLKENDPEVEKTGSAKRFFSFTF